MFSGHIPSFKKPMNIHLQSYLELFNLSQRSDSYFSLYELSCAYERFKT